MKLRLDKLLTDCGLAPSRERAQAMILAGRVLINEQKVTKAGAQVEESAEIRLLGDDMPYVSRGGLKLERALEHWGISCEGKTGLDVGASTGGFTDCLLQHGAGRVIAIDTGYGQIDTRLRNDPRVRLLERTNARYLEPEVVTEDVDIIAMDVSFISATLVLPAVLRAVGIPPFAPNASAKNGAPNVSGTPTDEAKPRHRRDLIVLVKPQFEVGRERVGKGGIVRDEAAQQDAVVKVRTAVEQLGGRGMEVIDSPILGTEGNKEFLLHAVFGVSSEE
jgi:23S rRNA (cytidine1920-2'-O)/16S rRNA (cytidine1409-2'-O)-methyltransferase